MIRDLTNPVRLEYAHPRTVGILNDWDNAVVVSHDRTVHDHRAVSDTIYDPPVNVS